MARNLPQNIEAEQALLGTIIVYPNAMRTCFDNDLKAIDFFAERNQKIYQALLDLYREEKPRDFTSLLARLNDLKISEEVGGVDYLSSLSDNVVSGYSAEHYIKLIQEKALLRKMIQVNQEIIQASFDNSYQSDEVLEKAEQKILGITRSRRTSDFRKIPEVVNEVLDTINLLKDTKGKPTGVRSGFRRLDGMTHGFQKGDLIILAARPSVGKTAFALNVAVNAAQNEEDRKRVAIFSLEMPAESLVIRMLAYRSQLNISQLRSGKFSDDTEGQNQWTALHEASARLRQMPIYLDDSPLIRVSEIFAKCRKLQHEQGLDLIIVDYLQLITANKSSDSRQQEVSEISRNLKALARELNVPVIALSQLNRSPERGRDSREPRLSDLRESGSIEQDADLVIFLYGKETKERKEEEINVPLTLLIAKHRNGPTGWFDMSFTKPCNAFLDYDETVGKDPLEHLTDG